jgi:hypothetical protein
MRRRVGSARAANVRSRVLGEYLTIWLNILHEALLNANQKIRAFFELKNETKLSNPQARGRGGLLTTPFFDINSRAGARSLDNNEP